MSNTRKYRCGFTTIEVLVVVTIIAILTAFIAAGVVRVRASALHSGTVTTLTKLASVLDVQWKAVIDAAKKDYNALPNNIKQNLLTLANNPGNPPGTAAQPVPHPRRDDRARLLYVKFRLKQEFPTSFAMALDPAPGFLPSQIVPGYPNQVTGKPAYVKFVAEFMTKNNVPLASLDKYPSPHYQSAILLVLALEQSRSGLGATSLDQVVGANYIRQGFDDEVATKFANASLNKSLTLPRHLVDAWERPLQLFIFPVAPPPAGSDSATDLAASADPQDPEGLLKPLNISKWAPAPALANSLPHPQTDGRRLVPVIASAGPDGLMGGTIQSAYKPDGTWATTDGGWAASNPFMALPNPGAFDNIYSFRLRQTGARGD